MDVVGGKVKENHNGVAAAFQALLSIILYRSHVHASVHFATKIYSFKL